MKNTIEILVLSVLILTITTGCVKEAGKQHTYASGIPHDTPYGTLYIPKEYSSDRDYPLLIILHGMNGHYHEFFRTYSWKGHADAHEYIVLSLRCNGTVWNEQPWEGEPSDEDIKKVGNGIRFVRRHASIRDDKTIIAGFSAGAHFIHTLILENASFFQQQMLFDAFVSFSGGNTYEWTPYLKGDKHLANRYAIPGLYFWGTQEVPKPGKAMYEYFLSHGWQVSSLPHTGGHIIPDEGIAQAFHWMDEIIP